MYAVFQEINSGKPVKKVTGDMKTKNCTDRMVGTAPEKPAPRAGSFSFKTGPPQNGSSNGPQDVVAAFEVVNCNGVEVQYQRWYGCRAMMLETVAAVPGMVGGLLRALCYFEHTGTSEPLLILFQKEQIVSTKGEGFDKSIGD